MCTIVEYPIPPCRSLCEAARTGCESLINKFGFTWPENLNCGQFPHKSQDNMCVGEDEEDISKGSHTPHKHSVSSADSVAVLEDDYSFVCPARLQVSQRK